MFSFSANRLSNLLEERTLAETTHVANPGLQDPSVTDVLRHDIVGTSQLPFPDEALPLPEAPSLKILLPDPKLSFAYLQLPELSASVIGSDDAPGRVLGAASAFCFRAVLVKGVEGLELLHITTL